jgi:hypothetical protein
MYQNQKIDWYIFTDNKGWNNKYNNVHIIPMTFEELAELINLKLGTVINSVYKLCDYKPAYGYIFNNYIQNYEFWGYCDIDVIFGNLDRFFTSERLKEFDKIYDLGHLSILKNTEDIRCAFMGTQDCIVPYKDILNHKYICVFDEPYCVFYDPINKYNNGGINQILAKEGYSVYENKYEIADIDIKYQNFHMLHGLDEKNNGDYYLIYTNRKLTLNRLHNKQYEREVAYAHFQKKKDIPVLTGSYNSYAATPKGFIDLEEVSETYFYSKKDLKILWYLKFRIKRHINNYLARLWQLKQRRK